MNHKFLECLLLIFYIRHAKSTTLISETIILHQTFSTTRFLLTGSLSFIAAAVSSAAGLGGGSLFIPILTIFAGLDVKTASSYSAFMVTGGSIANVANNLLSRNGAKRLIDYDIALLCQPWMLLGVSCGVILNRVFPEWLIMVIFVVLVAFCTFKTCKSGVLHWKMESRGLGRDVKMENEDCCGSTQEPLLGDDCDIVDQGILETPWMKIGMLVVIWVCFFVLYLLRGNHYGQGIIKIEACGIGYWIISSMQIPLAIIFTSWILFRAKNNASTQQENRELTRSQPADRLIFPIMALLAGTLGGIFGIGGGMIISPILLQLGIKPEVTAATSSFMILFTSTMSAIQYLLLGMEQIYGALIYTAICFIASLVGLTIIQQALLKHGRPSLIVFSVGTVMALSIVFMTSFGAIDIWRDYISGQSMGFKKPC
ncbi:hypothetical protein ACS0TY_031929 [Phlomoides rotata]